MLQTLLDHIAGQQDELIDLQKHLVAIPALGPSNGGQGEKAKATFLRDYLKKINIENVSEIHIPDTRVACGYRPSIVAKIAGKDSTRTLWIIGHIDIVPAGDETLWRTPPFELHRDGDLIFGRGVEDNHQGLTAALLVGKGLMDLSIVPDINLGLIFVADEETGSKYGLDAIIDKHPELFAPTDLFLIPDSGVPTSDMIEIAEKSQLWVKVTVTGKQCHASTPQEGINSLRGAAAMILAVDEMHQKFSASNPLFSPPISTFSPTKKEANVDNINTLPGKDVFYIDSRILPEYPIDTVLEELERISDRVGREYQVAICCETVQREDAAPPTDPNSDFVRGLAAAIKKIYKVEATTQGIGGGTVAAILRRKGYPAIVWSTLLNYAHQPNERASLTNTLKDSQVMACMLFN